MKKRLWQTSPLHIELLTRKATLPLVGEVFAGVYRIQRVLGRGGSSTVYQATIEGREQEVALKILRPELLEMPAQVERFRREALHVSNLRHPNTVRLFDYGQLSNGLVFAAIELLRGQPLGERLSRKGKLPMGEALNIIVQVLYSLSEAHGQNIIHRDLKPANIFLCQEPARASVRVLDFGMALALDTLQVRLTTQGNIPGTPQYMAPEQASDQPLSKATDIYAIGLIFYEMLTGQHPFRGMRDPDVLFRKRHRVQRYNLDALPPEALAVESVIARSLAPEPLHRYVDADEMLFALEERIVIPSPVSVDELYSITAVQERHRWDVILTLLERADGAMRGGDWLKARDSYQSALGIMTSLEESAFIEMGEVNQERGRALLSLAKAHRELNASGVAEDALREATRFLTPGSVADLEARTLLAGLMVEQGEHERAAAFYDAVLAEMDANTPVMLRDKVHLGFARVALLNGDFADSLDFAQRQESSDQTLRFQALELTLQALCGQRRFEEAWEQVEQVELDSEARFKLLWAAGALAASHGQLEEAVGFLERALELDIGKALRFSVARRLAELEVERGRGESARYHSGRAVAIAQQMNDRWREIAARLALGEVLAFERAYDQAIEQIRAARRLQKSVHDREGLARTHYVLGDVCWRAGDLKRARKYFKEAVRYEDEQPTEFMVMAVTRVAEVTEAMGGLARALDYYKYAIQVAGRLGVVQVGNRPRLGMARLQLVMGDYLMAESLFQQIIGATHADTLAREVVHAGLYLNWLYTFWGQGATIPPEIDEAITSVRGGVVRDLSPLLQQWRHDAGGLLHHVSDDNARAILTKGLQSVLTEVQP
ncbi:MAG: hypothetical protein CMH57_10140 [Myxococcales bacterium]|nr:hypothetical protein [Myxococcales bacterium]